MKAGPLFFLRGSYCDLAHHEEPNLDEFAEEFPDLVRDFQSLKA